MGQTRAQSEIMLSFTGRNGPVHIRPEDVKVVEAVSAAGAQTRLGTAGGDVLVKEEAGTVRDMLVRSGSLRASIEKHSGWPEAAAEQIWKDLAGSYMGWGDQSEKEKQALLEGWAKILRSTAGAAEPEPDSRNPALQAVVSLLDVCTRLGESPSLGECQTLLAAARAALGQQDGP